MFVYLHGDDGLEELLHPPRGGLGRVEEVEAAGAGLDGVALARHVVLHQELLEVVERLALAALLTDLDLK